MTLLWKLLLTLGLLGLVTACGSPGPSEEELQQTVEASVLATVNAMATVDTAVAETVAVNIQSTQEVAIAPTWTVEPTVEPSPENTETPPATNTPSPTAEPTQDLPTHTPVPTNTPVPAPTNTPAPTQPPPPPAEPTTPPNPTFGPDILPNGSFEGGWYNQHNIPELQLPNGYGFEYDLGATGYGGAEWDQYYRPETRVWPSSQIPPHEQSLFLQDGQYTLKMFKGNGPISFRLFADVALEPGTYLFRIRAYPDLVMGYDGNNKVFADDPLAGEIRFLSPSGGTGWILPGFGRWNVLEHTFSIDSPQTVRIGIGVRSRYALQNNGWFFDNWDLHKMEGG